MPEKSNLALYVVLADLHVYELKAHNFHWNVRGPQFYTLHEKTQMAYELFATIYDDLAERIIQLEGKPLVTLQAIIAKTRIKEVEQNKFTANEVINAMISDYLYIHAQMKELAALSENDVTTSAYAQEKIALFEKELWMLRAHLEN